MRLFPYSSIFARRYPKGILELKFDSDVKYILGNHSEEFLAKIFVYSQLGKQILCVNHPIYISISLYRWFFRNFEYENFEKQYYRPNVANGLDNALPFHILDRKAYSKQSDSNTEAT